MRSNLYCRINPEEPLEDTLITRAATLTDTTLLLRIIVFCSFISDAFDLNAELRVPSGKFGWLDLIFNICLGICRVILFYYRKYPFKFELKGSEMLIRGTQIWRVVLLSQLILRFVLNSHVRALNINELFYILLLD